MIADNQGCDLRSERLVRTAGAGVVQGYFAESNDLVVPDGGAGQCRCRLLSVSRRSAANTGRPPRSSRSAGRTGHGTGLTALSRQSDCAGIGRRHSAVISSRACLAVKWRVAALRNVQVSALASTVAGEGLSVRPRVAFFQ
jgi:hypothetical protein